MIEFASWNAGSRAEDPAETEIPVIERSVVPIIIGTNYALTLMQAANAALCPDSYREPRYARNDKYLFINAINPETYLHELRKKREP